MRCCFNRGPTLGQGHQSILSDSGNRIVYRFAQSRRIEGIEILERPKRVDSGVGRSVLIGLKLGQFVKWNCLLRQVGAQAMHSHSNPAVRMLERFE